MADNKTEYIAEDNKYTIVCPYCFNKASGGDGSPFPHTKVEFRSETSFQNIHEIEQKLGVKELDLELIDDLNERVQKTKQFETYKKFCVGKDQKYQLFWDKYGGKTTERASRVSSVQNPWELPIISIGNGIDHLVADIDGFVTHAIDVFGKTTHNRVCPYCHNPLPLGFGKNKVRSISIIGITGSGKTVYIAQLLKGMTDYASKVGLNAFFTSDNESIFIQENQVKLGKQLPNSAPPPIDRLSQPLFYDVVRDEQKVDTIVLYDIGGDILEGNHWHAEKEIELFSQFIEHSDGIIILVDPKQLGFFSEELDDDDKIGVASLTLSRLHSILESDFRKKCSVPIAVCLSKSDQCAGILSPISQETVQSTGLDPNGLPLMEFDGKSFNKLIFGDHGLVGVFFDKNPSLCHELETLYSRFNFFAVSATGNPCEVSATGFFAPVNRPEPKRIEEPILWLFKQFGFIESNEKVLRPFPIAHANRYVYKKPFFKKPYLKQLPTGYAYYEEDEIFFEPMVKKRNKWYKMNDEFDKLPIK